MKYLLSIWLWVIGIIYLVLFVLLLIFISYLFPKKKYDPFMKVLARFIFKILFIRVEVKGIENVDKSAIYVVMGNHVSMFDIPLMFGFLPTSFVGIEAAEHFRTPIYSQALKRYGNIPINRKNSHESMQSILKGVEKIKEGNSVVILPEGTRTKTPEMGSFKKFPFVLAKRSGKEILPFGFSGLWKINNKTSWLIKPGKVVIEFGKPISSELIQNTEINDLMALVRDDISKLIKEP